MKKYDTHIPSQKRSIRLFAVFIIIGIILMSGTLYFSRIYSLNEARKTMERNIRDLKKQCNEYSDFLSSDKAKSLMRLTEQADAVSSSLSFIEPEEREAFLKRYYDIQRLDCILILDEDLSADGEFTPLGMDYDAWESEINNPSIETILTYPKKVYSARIKHGGNTYDIAAAARQDKKGVVFCAALQENERLEIHYSPVKNLLATIETYMQGVLYITEGDEIIASNTDTDYAEKAQIPQLSIIDSLGEGNKLTRFKSGGTAYYGGSAKCRSYDIYAFYPTRWVFASCTETLLVAFCIYMLLTLAAVALHYRSKLLHDRELSRQYGIIRTVSHIYTMTVLVDIEKRTYKLLKRPNISGSFKDEGEINEASFDSFVSHVDERYREGFLRFIKMSTIDERLCGQEYFEYNYKDDTGEWISDQIIAQTRGENGKVASFILTRKNISAQKKSELEYQRKLEAAVKNEQLANQSKTEFLRRMSHDIRTPINVIVGMIEISDRNPSNFEILTSCRKKCRVAVEYLLELVNDILTMNKLDADSSENDAAFSLEEEVRRMYLIAVERAKAVGAQLLPPEVKSEKRLLCGNSLYLRQIMMNIVINAIRYSGDGGKVRVSVSEEPCAQRRELAEVKFICEDNGIGMSRDFQEKMFEPFAQENSSDKSGVGLGLSIVRKLVDKLGGHIDVDSEKGRGTRFEITLPYRYANPAEKSRKGGKKSGTSIEGFTILLAEDNELNMEIAEYIIKDAGAKAVRARNGREAVELFEKSKPYEIDAVLTDMTMPVMDGLEEARQIRALDRPDAKEVPIIAMTANLFEDDIKACTEAGMTGFVAKPLDVENLLSMIARQADGDFREF